MKELITEIQDQLQEDTNLSYIADDSIFVSIDENIIPEVVTFPAIGIKDGNIQYNFEEGETWEPNYYVDLIIYTLMTATDLCIMGDGTDTNTTYGVLKIADDIHASLIDNFLSITGIELALPISEKASEALIMGDLALQKKVITYRYRKSEATPT